LRTSKLIEAFPHYTDILTPTERRILAHLHGVSRTSAEREAYYGKRSVARDVACSPTTARVALQKFRWLGFITDEHAVARGCTLPGAPGKQREARCATTVYRVDMAPEQLDERFAAWREHVGQQRAAERLRAQSAAFATKLTRGVETAPCLILDRSLDPHLPPTTFSACDMQGAGVPASPHGDRNAAPAAGAGPVAQSERQDRDASELVSAARAHELDTKRDVSPGQNEEAGKAEASAKSVLDFFALKLVRPGVNFDKRKWLPSIARLLARPDVTEQECRDAIAFAAISPNNRAANRRTVHQVLTRDSSRQGLARQGAALRDKARKAEERRKRAEGAAANRAPGKGHSGPGNGIVTNTERADIPRPEDYAASLALLNALPGAHA
jgi:hypothetical protein